MYENVLVTTDGSEYAERGVDHALDLAEKYGATLHVVYVVDERRHGRTPALSSYEAALEKVEEEGEEIAEDVVEDANELDLPVTVSILRGAPHEEILRYVDAHDIDIVVMGKRGATGVERPHIGSVTDRVIRESPVPVLPV
jgi:nucleotide-binding universal stress UspA family protein